MRATLGWDPSRDLFRVYMGGEGLAIVMGANGLVSERKVVEVEPHTEMPPFMELSNHEYDALRDAILMEEMPNYGELQTLAANTEDARATRDRLLTLVERLVD